MASSISLNQAEDAANRRPRLIIPGLAGFYDSVQPYCYPLLRFITGAMLLPAGWSKLWGGLDPVVASMVKNGIAPAVPMAIWIITIESLGAVSIAIGLFTRFWAAALAIEMAVIAQVYWPNGYFRAEPFLMWGIVSLIVALRGGGKLSVDRVIGWEL